VWDESNLYIEEGPKRTLVAEGETQFVVVPEETNKCERYDIIIVITADRVLPPIIYSPEDRREWGVSGIRIGMIEDYIQDILAQAVNALDRYPLYLLMDRAPCHVEDKIKAAFQSFGLNDITELKKYPPRAAKRISPLDNALIHEWKEKVRSNYPITKNNIKSIMTKCLNEIPVRHIRNYYRHCGYTYAHSPYFDCPAPAQHRHASSTSMAYNVM
jgi:hypothetical protein